MINNQELYSKSLKDCPPQYRIGDKVKTSQGISYINGHVFKEREKVWKYTMYPHGLKNFLIDVDTVYVKVE
jgi:hypothetical protein